jgi:hypothetical protein
MEALRQYIQHQIKHTEDLVEKSGQPNEAQLTQYVRSISNQLLQRMTPSIPTAVKAVCRGGLTAMGILFL